MFHKVCQTCGKEFTAQSRKRRFCSRSCANSFNTRQRWTEDESVFGGPSFTPDEAYILGLICADGCLTFDKHSGRWRLVIASKDRDLMEALRRRMTPAKKLYCNRGCYYVISNNRTDINFLVSIGILDNKSSSIQVPWIPEHLQSHFIRGVFDGDGSVFRSRTTNQGRIYNYVGVTITTGSYEFAVGIRKILIAHGIDASIILDSRSRTGSRNPTWYVRLSRKSALARFYEWIYSDATLYMPSKREKFAALLTGDDIVRPTWQQVELGDKELLG